jgi:FMN phosphatase YigB (HAD superfamily)
MASASIRVIFFDLGETLVTGARAWMPDAQATLASLKAQGFRLGVISNTGNLDRAALLALLPVDFDLAAFETGLTLFSSEVGTAKPNREIFDKAVAASGVSAARCLYCSESAVETLVAQHVGMRTWRIATPPGLASLSSDLAAFQALI